MNQRELYENVVSEVEADISLITTQEADYVSAVQKESITISLPKGGVTLKTPTSAFADYKVRDNVLLKSMESEEFAFVLLNKIGNTFKTKLEADSPITQDDVEAISVAGHVCAMWEQFGSALAMIEMLTEVLEKDNNLTEPTLNGITKRLIANREVFPFAKTRADMLKDLKPKSYEGGN